MSGVASLGSCPSLISFLFPSPFPNFPCYGGFFWVFRKRNKPNKRKENARSLAGRWLAGFTREDPVGGKNPSHECRAASKRKKWEREGRGKRGHKMKSCATIIYVFDLE